MRDDVAKGEVVCAAPSCPCEHASVARLLHAKDGRYLGATTDFRWDISGFRRHPESGLRDASGILRGTASELTKAAGNPGWPRTVASHLQSWLRLPPCSPPRVHPPLGGTPARSSWAAPDSRPSQRAGRNEVILRVYAEASGGVGKPGMRRHTMSSRPGDAPAAWVGLSTPDKPFR